MKAKFVRFDWENRVHTIASFYFRPDKPYYFTAGQYADFTVPHEAPDQRGLTRTMTIINKPSDTLIGFTTRFSAKNSSYKQALLQLKAGDVARITDPMGDMVLPLDESIPLVFVAGGVAIASYVSMIRWLTEQKDSRAVTLLFAVRNREDIIFQTDFEAYQHIGSLQKKLFTTGGAVSSEHWAAPIVPARLTSRDIMAHLPSNGQVYLSGSERMVEQLRRELEREYKVEQYRIAFDYYDGYTEL